MQKAQLPAISQQECISTFFFIMSSSQIVHKFLYDKLVI